MTIQFPQVHSFSNRSIEQSLRLTSLDHLGVIAARLRKDATTSSEQDHEELIEILSQVLQTKMDHRSPSPTAKMVSCNYWHDAVTYLPKCMTGNVSSTNMLYS